MLIEFVIYTLRTFVRFIFSYAYLIWFKSFVCSVLFISDKCALANAGFSIGDDATTVLEHLALHTHTHTHTHIHTERQREGGEGETRSNMLNIECHYTFAPFCTYIDRQFSLHHVVYW